MLRNLFYATVLIAVIALPLAASPFIGPVSPYYLSNVSDNRIYVVQGTQVLYSFPWAYTPPGGWLSEGVLAVSGGTVRTRATGDTSAYTGGGQYSLDGTPLGISDSYPLPIGIESDRSYDGTSDGIYNYYVQFDGYSNGNTAENVYRTDLDWSNPVFLFALKGTLGWSQFEYQGITYDATNNSLWLSPHNGYYISNYSMAGDLLSQFSVPNTYPSALGLDPADNTLWVLDSYFGNQLDQYSKGGTLLQDGVPTGLPSSYYFGGELAPNSSTVPEPTSLILVGTGLAGICLAIRRGRK